jgi:pyridoxine 5-phosphate synthase
MIRLGVNIDHVATLRQVRHVAYPNLLAAAEAAVRGGADLITVHLREDRRHIQPEDVIELRRKLSVPLNLEMAMTDSMIQFALEQKPDWVCLVPESREELTTEGGLDVCAHRDRFFSSVSRLKRAGVRVSPFIEADEEAIRECGSCECDAVEIHTGQYANAAGEEARLEFNRIRTASLLVQKLGMQCHAGHGLTLENVGLIAEIPQMEELNIGHSIVADSVFVGMEQACRRMKQAMERARYT